MITTMTFLWSTSEPWIYVGVGEQERIEAIPSLFYSTPEIDDVCVRRLRGWKMRDQQGLMNEFGAAFQFFDGFGENWYALGETLSFLDEWLRGHAYVVVVERAEEILIDDERALEALLLTLNEVGESWSKAVDSPDIYARPAIPFHVLLNVSPSNPEAISRIARAAAAVYVPIRTD